jgi:hypothetical protein
MAMCTSKQYVENNRSCASQFPPASPASNELDVHNPEVIVFLIGAYAKYNWPYVWVRDCNLVGYAWWWLYVRTASIRDSSPMLWASLHSEDWITHQVVCL